MAFTQRELGYNYNALEPHIDARTMEIHYSKHHAAYTANFNKAVEGTALDGKSIEEIFAGISGHPAAVRNNGGGFYNHNIYWSVMGPNGGGEPTGKLLDAINKAFGSFADFKTKFNTAAATRFGSGWAWLVQQADGSLVVTSTPNQDNPLMDIAEVKGTALLTIDVWEHAYYLNYQNRRPDYIEAFWNVVNWDAVASQFK
jgi:Fe-Mn family superoxide dismutase